MLLPQQDVDTLPTRRLPKYIDGRLISAKSDWYWRLGAGRFAARALRDESIAAETNHEYVAGLFALALASELARGEAGGIAALGDRDGIYLVASDIDESWTADVERIGIAHGHVTFSAHPIAPPATNVQTLVVPNVPEDDSAHERQDSVLVVLNDNGGLNVAANPWLEEVNIPCRLEAGDMSFTVEAAFQRRTDMFRITPSAISLAKRLRFTGAHLSKATLVSFEALVATEAGV